MTKKQNPRPQNETASGVPQGASLPPADPPLGAPAAYKPRQTPLWNNAITMLGMFVAIIGLLGLFTFGLFSLFGKAQNPYVDIVGYLMMPTILITGMILMPLGILFKSWRLHRRNPQEPLGFLFPHIDLSDPAQRKAAKVVIGGTFVLLPVVGLSSYHGYHYTDSADFCAKPCHAVMEPQATTYRNSAHARVRCAECHIGAGASWFVKSKLSGTRQVIATWRDTYPRPIPPAITELRPARETCEECHWPKKFFGAQLAERVRFGPDEQNTRHTINMLIKTGGGDTSTGRRAEGIHAHMALSGRIEYVATDAKLQVIPWVKKTALDGTEAIYRSDGKPSSDPRPEGTVRVIDCMDCHNRPAHKFLSPSEAADLALEVGKIDATLPFIKREAVAVLAEPYSDLETARTRIGEALTTFYQQQYADLYAARQVEINQAIDAVRDAYQHNFFPMMKVTWQTYPDNIGHKISAGCFRCHEGRHVNQRGEVLSRDCDACHSFLNPVTEPGGGEFFQRGQFIHSFKLEGPHAAARCDGCHTGGPSPDPTCAGCHTRQADFRSGKLAAFAAFKVEADPMAEGVSCEDCHDLSQPTTQEALGAKCTGCHDESYAKMLPAWQTELDGLLRAAEQKTDTAGRHLLETLREAGPLHNPQAARTIAKALAAGPAPTPAAGNDRH
jgi:hypothetical protein